MPLAFVAAGLAVDQAAMIVFGVVYFGVRRWVVRRQLAPYLAGERVVRVRITDQAYESHDGEVGTTRAWTRFTQARRSQGFWLLRMVDHQVVVLPEAALDPNQSAAFDDLLRRAGLLPTPIDAPSPPGPP